MLKLEDLLEAKHKPISKWYPLGEKTQRSGGDGSRGSLQVIAQWRYNKDLDFEPFSVPPRRDFRTSSCVDGVFMRPRRLDAVDAAGRRAYAAVSRQIL